MRKVLFAGLLLLLFCLRVEASTPDDPVRLFKLQSALALPVLINNQTLGTFILDTGSSYTALTPHMAKRLMIKNTARKETRTIYSIQGPQEVPVVHLDSMRIGSTEVMNPDVVIIDFNRRDPLFAGILGMDILSRFNWQISSNALVLTPKGDETKHPGL